MVRSSRAPSPDPRGDTLAAAVYRTLLYADLFEYPLTVDEAHRYLHGWQATLDEVRKVLQEGLPGVVTHDGLYALAGRLATIAERRRREAISAPLLARAMRYGVLLKHLPFLRMVGVTGSLSVKNLSGAPDIDLMVVAAPGRVWLCRAGVIAVVRLARLAGDTLCPNYVVSERHLALDTVSVYEAHELAQMVPIHGRSAYHRLWSSNPEVLALLPNAQPHALPPDRLLPGLAGVKWVLERLLGGGLGARLEAWERCRKTARLTKGKGTPLAEIVLSAEQCKGHFGGHRARILAGYRERLNGSDDCCLHSGLEVP